VIVERVGRDELEFEGTIILRKVVPYRKPPFISLMLMTVDPSRPTRSIAKALTLWLPWSALPVHSDVTLSKIAVDEAAVGEALSLSAGIDAESCWTVNRRRMRVASVCVRRLSLDVRKAKARVDGELSLALTPGRRMLDLTISNESDHLYVEAETAPLTPDEIVDRKVEDVRASEPGFSRRRQLRRLAEHAEGGAKRAGSALRSFAKDRALEPPARDYANTLLAALKAGQALPEPPL
jgi:hypothetical protein